jgi:hypothetical protein
LLSSAAAAAVGQVEANRTRVLELTLDRLEEEVLQATIQKEQAERCA